MNEPIKPNFMKPRWSKVLSDVWDDKTRTLLVVASIAVGVFALGMIISTYTIMNEDINRSYSMVNPANVTVWMEPFEQDIPRIIEKIPGVAETEGRRIFNVRGKLGDENWQTLTLISMESFPGEINHLDTLEGRQIPGKDEVVISQDFQNNTGWAIGDVIEIEFPDSNAHMLTVVGLVIDQAMEPDPSSGAIALVSMDSLRAYGLGTYFNRLLVTVEGEGSDAVFIETIADQVEEKIEWNNKEIFRIKENLSTEHPMIDSLLAIIGVLGVLGGLVTVLSSSLIINTLNALLTQQMRQIGVMKLVGGRSKQILGMYIVLILIYGAIALLIAVPLGAIAGYGLAYFIAYLTGAVLQGFRIIPMAIVVQVILAILVPLGAGFVPVNRGAKTNVRRAISNYRPGTQGKKRLSFNLNLSWFSKISRPILLSFRNTFRKTGRLLLTIFTLTIAGAVFIAVFNVRDSMSNMMEQLLQHFMGDVTINFTQPYQNTKVERDLLKIPGVEGVEAWGGTFADVWDEDDEVVTSISISAPPQDTQLLSPDFVAGRWLLPNEQKALVLSDKIYEYYPGLEMGDTLLVKIPGNRVEEWEVVGVFPFSNAFGDIIGYASFDIIADKTNLPNQAASYRLITSAQDDLDSQTELTGNIDEYLNTRNYKVGSIQAGITMREQASLALNTLVIFLLIMAVLTAFVGSIGLTGTMSINVLERTREIGVMRTIGAVDTVIMQSVIIEGLVIGLITWILAIVLSFPISTVLLTIVGEAMIGSPMDMAFTPFGILLWLGIVVVLSIVASIMPARNAARLTINEVLAYE